LTVFFKLIGFKKVIYHSFKQGRVFQFTILPTITRPKGQEGQEGITSEGIVLKNDYRSNKI
ncbi:MAG TPA: hypothetical protein DIT95_12685, partial [Arenibacter sp.]|nr:hypothetical protein [Arenibacter sp.]